MLHLIHEFQPSIIPGHLVITAKAGTHFAGVGFHVDETKYFHTVH
jgi:hypothetical protein